MSNFEDDDQIYAVGERILVQLVRPEEKKGILILPEEDEMHQVGKVVSIGCDADDDWMKEGDFVYSRKYAGLALTHKGHEYVSLKIDEILAVSKEI